MTESIITTRSQREEDKSKGDSVKVAYTQPKDIPTDSSSRSDTSEEDEAPSNGEYSRRKSGISSEDEAPPRHKSEKNEKPDYHRKRTSSVKRTSLKTN